MKIAFYFILQGVFVLKIIKFFTRRYWSCKKRFHKKAKVNFKNYDVGDWEKTICNTHIVQYLKK